ncbi:VOC family protein [Aestuariicella hydrocarbonica]|uniref:VOC family protein n=1 Tax=Pseudomaricurvus hydrocarbonicus TaxID=1470433 RepID=A0A9E5K132_9GAMM|nr:VOC family protein [Aestuariicella hydrocarbonica]NHO66842.1 VOC family protein [Aestuariicella hydrocarbonica]
MIRGAHHIAISTPNLKRALSFYQDLLGFRQVSDTSWPEGTQAINAVLDLKDSAAQQIMLRGDNLCIELFEFVKPLSTPSTELPSVNTPGLTHICFDVIDIETEYQRLKDAGIHFHVPPQDFGSVKATYGRDPDGNVFELQEIISPDAPERLWD